MVSTLEKPVHRAWRLPTTLLILAFFWLSGPPVAFSEIIRSFDTSVRLEKDASLDVTETITIDFEDAQRHGIYRDIPVEYERYGNEYSVYLRIESITNGAGRSISYSTSHQGRELHLRIGDAGRVVTGVNVYRLHYKVLRAVNFFKGAPEVYWNVTGNDWPYPIQEVSAEFTAPEGISNGQIRTACYVGPPGSTQSGQIDATQPGKIEFLSGNLGSGEGLTFVAGLPAGYVEPPSGFQELLWWFADWWPAVVLPGATLVGMFALWMQRGRDAGSGGAIPVEWAATKGLSPAEVGTLIDESCDLPDITSTLVDLAARGHLKIEELKTSSLLFMSARDYRFNRTVPPPVDPLAPHEARFMEGVFGQRKTVVDLSDLKYSFYSFLPNIRSDVYQQLVDKNFFTVRPDTVRQSYGFGGVILIVLGFVLTWVGFQSGHLSWGLGLLLAGAVVLAFVKAMPAKTLLGSQTLREVLGFRRFLSLVEKDRIARMVKEDPTIFGRLLPFAMVLGVADQWAHAFDGLALTPPDWYVPLNGYNNFNTYEFTHNLGGGMHSMSQTFTSQPPSTSSGGGGGSGFSGGGSGGGFGGGGGGSW